MEKEANCDQFDVVLLWNKLDRSYATCLLASSLPPIVAVICMISPAGTRNVVGMRSF